MRQVGHLPETVRQVGHLPETVRQVGYLPETVRQVGHLPEIYTCDVVEITNKMQPCIRIYYSTVH